MCIFFNTPGTRGGPGLEREREKERKWPATHCNATSGGARKAAWAKKHITVSPFDKGPTVIYIQVKTDSKNFLFSELYLFSGSMLLIFHRNSKMNIHKRYKSILAIIFRTGLINLISRTGCYIFSR